MAKVSADVISVFAQRSWQAVSGLLTIIFITHFLSPVLQGWYYSFLSIAALYTLVDLGLSVVLVQISAHLFVGLQWLPHGEITGAEVSKFKSLVGRSTRHYLLLAFIFALLAIPGGMLFFSQQPNLNGQEISWFTPWVTLALITAVSILSLPFLAIVEGCGKVQEVYSVRLAQGVVGSLTCWAVMFSGGALWATVMVPASAVTVSAVWLLLRHPALLIAACNRSDHYLNWGRDVWPLQWRVGLSWLSGYLLTQIYTPVLFHYQGAVVAGQMGLTLTIANMLGLLAQSWIARHVPAMAHAAAKREWVVLDSLFHRDLLVSSAAYLAGAAILCIAHLFLSGTVYGGRILDFLPFVGLLAVVFMNHIIGALAAQLRSYKREPLVWVAAAGALLTAPSAFWAASVYSANGVIAIILGVQVLMTFPLSIWLWQRCNKVWREES